MNSIFTSRGLSRRISHHPGVKIMNSNSFSDSFNDKGFGFEDWDKPKRSRAHFIPIILIGGLFSSFLVLATIYIVSVYTEYNLLAFTLNFIPVGAILGGLLAGCGYAFGARWTQYLPSSGFLAFIFLLQFGFFFGGRYLEYLAVFYNMEPVQLEMKTEDGETRTVLAKPRFWPYYRWHIEESQWTSGRGNKEPYTLGKAGWLLEIASALCFAGMSLVGPLVLAGFAYCKDCRLFMKKKLEFSFPARAPSEKIKKKDTEALEAFQQKDADFLEAAMGRLTEIVDFLQAEPPREKSDVYSFLEQLRDNIGASAESCRKAVNTIKITFNSCSDCANYQIVAAMLANPTQENAALKGGELLKYLDGQFLTRNIPSSTEIETEISKTDRAS